MDSIEGVWFPEGGIHAVPMIMAQVAEKAGVTFRYGDAAEEVLRSAQGRVAGVRTASGERIVADAVVCTLDLPTAYEKLLPDLSPPRALRPAAIRRRRWSGTSGYAVCRRPEAAHHNIHFGTSGAAPSTSCSSAEADGRRVAAGHHPLAGRPVPGTGGLLDAVRPGARPQPGRRDRLVERSRADA